MLAIRCSEPFVLPVGVVLLSALIRFPLLNALLAADRVLVAAVTPVLAAASKAAFAPAASCASASRLVPLKASSARSAGVTNSFG